MRVDVMLINDVIFIGSSYAFLLFISSNARVQKEVFDKYQAAKNKRLKVGEDRDTVIKNAHDSLLDDLAGRNRLPRNLLTATAQQIRQQSAILEEDFTHDHAGALLNKEKQDPAGVSSHTADSVGNATLCIFKMSVLECFESAWEKESLSSSSTPAAATNPTQAVKDEKNIRTVTLPLARLIRHDMPEQYRTRIAEGLERVQAEMSDFMDAVSMGAYKSTLWVGLLFF